MPESKRRTRLTWWLGVPGLAALLAASWYFYRKASPEEEWAGIEASIRASRWVEAEAALGRWLRSKPGDDQAWLRLGAVRAKQGRDGQALEALARVRESSSAWGPAQVQTGEIMIGRRRMADAERAFRAAAGRRPKAVAPRKRLVYLLTLQQRVDEARPVLWELYRLTNDPRHLVTLAGLRVTDPDGRDLTEDLQSYLKATPDDPLLNRAWGLALLRAGRPREARPYLEAALGAIDDDPAGRLALADCQVAMGDLGQARTTLAALPARPDDRSRRWLLLGEVEEAEGHLDEALACWEKAHGADPRSRAANYRLGQALVRRGRASEAKPFLDRAEAIRIREVTLVKTLDRLLHGGKDAEVFAQVGGLCEALGMPAEARAWYWEAIRLDPTRRDAQTALARLVVPEAEPPSPLRATGEIPAARLSAIAARPPEPSVRFEDVARRAGLDFRYDSGAKGDLFIGDTMGGGVGLFDYDDDGWLDVYLIGGCPLPYDPEHPPAPNRLYRNRRDGTFEDVTRGAGVGGRGYGMGCAVGDYDGDGHDDLFVTGLGETVLYRNRGDGTFEDVTGRAGVRSTRWSTAAGFGDLDGDGDLDLVVVTYVAVDPAHVPECRDPSDHRMHCPPGHFPAEFDQLFRNNGDGTFTDVSEEAGLEVPHGLGLGLAIADLDGDGKLDLFVANDAAPNFLFRNLGGLRFEEVGVPSGVAYDGAARATASMGVVADDLDEDGLIDLFHTNFVNEPNTLLHNLGQGQFADTTAASGLDAPSRPVTGFGTCALDADNDGVLDLFVANGHVDDRPWDKLPMAQPPHFYAGRGRGHYELAPGAIGPYFARPIVGRGAAAGDLDNDGRVDLVVVHRDAPVSLLRNTSSGGRWLGVRLRGTRSGRTPVGARVTCQAGGRTMVRWLTSGTSYLAASDPRIWFGLAGAKVVDRLEVRWPSGRVQVRSNIAADRLLEIDEGRDF